MLSRRSARKLLLAPIVSATLACHEATAPLRDDVYGFTLFQTGLVFRWSPDRLPVHFWVDPGAGPVASYVQRGLRDWSSQFLYREFVGVLVADSSHADVVIRVVGTTPPDAALTNDPPVPACGGVTSFDLDQDDRLTGPFRVTLDWDVRYPATDVANCLARVATHEIGHTVGLLAHSPNPLDLMHSNPTVTSPSPADRATVEVLYHTASSIHPPVRPQ